MADEPTAQPENYEAKAPPMLALPKFPPGTKDKIALAISLLRDGFQTPDGSITVEPNPDVKISTNIDGDTLQITLDPPTKFHAKKWVFRYSSALEGVEITPTSIQPWLKGLPDIRFEVTE